MTTDTVPAQDEGLEALRSTMSDRVLFPGDPGWEQGKMPWAVAVPQQPVAVVVARDVEDVVQTVRIAADAGLSVAAQPVGHGATTAVNGAVVLRTRALDGIEVDTVRRTARVGAGVKWGELLAALAGSGLVPLVGSNPDPSVVGFTVGGGLSWFSRKHGLAANSVTSFDVVDPTGQLVRVTRDSDPDLFWALRGGGGDFGIVTAMELTLYPAPHIFGGLLMWPLEQAADVMSAFREVTSQAPDELSTWLQILRFPPIPDIPEPMRGKAFVTVSLTFLGTADAAEQALKPLRALPEPVMGGLDTVPVEAIGALNAEPVDPMPSMDFCSTLTDLDDQVIDRLLELVGPGVESPLMMVQIRHLGGAFARSRADHGAAPQLDEPYLLFTFGVPMSPELAAAIGFAQGQLREALAGYLTGVAPFNFVDDSDVGRIFPADTLARLRAIKDERDPAGVIRSNRPVRGAE